MRHGTLTSRDAFSFQNSGDIAQVRTSHTYHEADSPFTARPRSCAKRYPDMSIAAADPSPAAVTTCARGFARFPAAHRPPTEVRPVGPTSIHGVSPFRTSPKPSSASSRGTMRGTINAQSRVEMAPLSWRINERPLRATPHTGDAVVHYSDPNCRKLIALVIGEVDTVEIEDDIVRIPSHECGLVDRHRCVCATNDRDALTGDFPPVTVRAMVNEGPPEFLRSRNFGNFIPEAGREEDCRRDEFAAFLKHDSKLSPRRLFHAIGARREQLATEARSSLPARPAGGPLDSCRLGRETRACGWRGRCVVSGLQPGQSGCRCAASTTPALRPAAPPPTTMASHSLACDISIVSFSLRLHRPSAGLEPPTSLAETGKPTTRQLDLGQLKPHPLAKTA